MKKVEDMQEHTGNEHTKMNTLKRKKLKTVTEMKNIFVGRLNTDEKRISELEDRSKEVTQTKTQREKKNGGKEGTEHPRTMGTDTMM